MNLMKVQEDITELREQWVQPRVDRVTNNTFKLYQVRENLKQSKVNLFETYFQCNPPYLFL